MVTGGVDVYYRLKGTACDGNIVCPNIAQLAMKNALLIIVADERHSARDQAQ